MQKRSALEIPTEIISRVFDFYTVFSLIIFICYSTSLTDSNVSLFWALIFFFFLVLIPLTGDIYLVKSHKVSDWDIPDRAARVRYLDIEIITTLILLAAAIGGNAPGIFIATAMIFFLLKLLYGSITFYWKISIHAQMITLLVVYICAFAGKEDLFTALLIPPVFCARLILKRHTFLQLFMGSIITLLTSVLILALFGYI